MKLNHTNIEDFKARIAAITPTQAPKWGQLSPAKILRHLRAHLDVSLEREQVPDESTLMSRTLIKWLTFHMMTRWPKGLPAPREFFPEPNEKFEDERAALLQALDEFVQRSEAEPRRQVLSRAFGRASLSYWQRMHGLHFHHHLRQLGV